MELGISLTKKRLQHRSAKKIHRTAYAVRWILVRVAGLEPTAS